MTLFAYHLILLSTPKFLLLPLLAASFVEMAANIHWCPITTFTRTS